MIKYIFLGILQGVTEFLPVSSSGHLVIAQKFLNLSGKEVAISVILHLGTTLSLLTFFFKDILKIFYNARLLLLIIIVTLITTTIGIIGKDFFETLFTSVWLVGLTLLITGIILILTKRITGRGRDILDIQDAAAFGLAQAIAIIPGISRSGITISTLLFRKIDEDTAFRFSFLAAIPAILGATLLEVKEINSALKVAPMNLFLGFVFSFISGLFSLWLLKLVLHKMKFHYFGYYCIIVAVFILLFIT
ncbi:MAG: undecaprenyl-diphosphate phosphatase [Candidatus Omnitrophica bacterium]|nr:undecaprenyl-diphosphate phosphatase [Candidatus Omnitrophota bacterium]